MNNRVRQNPGANKIRTKDEEDKGQKKIQKIQDQETDPQKSDGYETKTQVERIQEQ